METRKNKCRIAFLTVSIALVCSAPSWARVKAWQGTCTIPTYGWAEDINPKFWAMEGQVKFSTTVKGTIVYPYTMQDHLYRTKEDRTYKALFLENEYLKITCLPELGGRLHSVFDKSKGEEMFHLNRVIKPSMIAMRGAFISGGVEWNAGPQVHTVTILSPVNALVGHNPDGSAYLQVSNLEKTLRTRWSVRLTLHPGRAYLDEQISIFNPTDAINPYYFWNCTAFPCHAGTRYIYPMTLGTDHGGEVFFNWPIHEGKDLSWLKNYETWASIFSVDCTYDFFGAYDVDADRGIVQVADHRELSGKKAWTWGNWDFGLVSQKNLTDADGPYIEVQSGPLPTQSDYGMLRPREQVSWQEWWYPVHGLGDGFEYVTKDLAIQSLREDQELKLKMIATGRFRRASCTVIRPGPEFLQERVDLSPAHPVVVSVPDVQGQVQVHVQTRQGDTLARFTTPLPIPEVKAPAPASFVTKPEEQLSAQEMFLKARKFDLATDRKQARIYYEKTLALDAGFDAALRNLAVLDYEAGLYEEAIEGLSQALARDAGDGLAWYFLGLSQLKLGDLDQALASAYRALRCFGSTSLGHDLAGRAFMLRKEPARALAAFAQAVQTNPHDVKARNHHLLALYATGDRSVFKQARAWIEHDPTDLIPRVVLGLQSDKHLKRFAEEARGFLGEPEFEMIETALVLKDLGMVQEAAMLLQAVCVTALPALERSPLPLYYLAYFHSLEGDSTRASDCLQRAAKMPRDYVFPSRPEAVDVLNYAVQANTSDAHAHLLLGNVYAHLGRLKEAHASWQKAVQINADLSVAWRNLGLHAWVVEADLGEAADMYRKAIAARAEDQTLYRDFSEILLADNQRDAAIRVLESTPFTRLRRADVIITLAQAYVDEARYAEAIALLESTPYFVNWEGQTVTWDLFSQAHIERGKQRLDQGDAQAALKDFEAALTYPENIGVGRSNEPKEAQAQYWRGKTLFTLERFNEARSVWELGAQGAAGGKEQDDAIKRCQAMLARTQ